MVDSVIGVLTQRSRRGSTAGRVLHEVVANDPDLAPPSVATLARRLRQSQSSVLREVDRLVAAGLLREQRAGRQRLLEPNRDSPLYGPVLKMLFLTYGTSEPPARSVGERITAATQARWFGEQSAPPPQLRDWIPETLHSASPGSLSREAPEDTYDGPDLMSARGRATALSQLARSYSWLHGVLQQSYGRWHDERDRDLIHRVGALGYGLDEAIRVLTRSADHAQHQRSPAAGRVGARAWALTTFCVHAESTQVQQRLVDWCSHGMTLIAHRAEQQKRIAHQRQLWDLAARDQRAPEASTATQRDAQAEIDEAAAAIETLETELRGYYRAGGTPGVDDVGTAGERLIIATFEPIVAELRQHVDDMAAEPCFARWRAELGARG